MGGIISAVVGLANQALSFVKQIKVESSREKNRKLSKEAALLASPIEPPEPWDTLEVRSKQVETGPYTVEAIRESLHSGVLPAGWSEEQLTNVGFSPEVKEYQDLLLTEQRALRKSFGSTLKALADAVAEQMVTDRRAYSDAGVTMLTVARFQNLAKTALEGGLTADAVSSTMSEIRTLMDGAVAEKGRVEREHALQEEVNVAMGQRDSALLNITRRAIAKRTGIAANPPVVPPAISAK